MATGTLFTAMLLASAVVVNPLSMYTTVPKYNKTAPCATLEAYQIRGQSMKVESGEVCGYKLSLGLKDFLLKWSGTSLIGFRGGDVTGIRSVWLADAMEGKIPTAEPNTYIDPLYPLPEGILLNKSLSVSVFNGSWIMHTFPNITKYQRSTIYSHAVKSVVYSPVKWECDTTYGKCRSSDQTVCGIVPPGSYISENCHSTSMELSRKFFEEGILDDVLKCPVAGSDRWYWYVSPGPDYYRTDYSTSDGLLTNFRSTLDGGDMKKFSDQCWGGSHNLNFQTWDTRYRSVFTKGPHVVKDYSLSLCSAYNESTQIFPKRRTCVPGYMKVVPMSGMLNAYSKGFLNVSFDALFIRNITEWDAALMFNWARDLDFANPSVSRKKRSALALGAIAFKSFGAINQLAGGCDTIYTGTAADILTGCASNLNTAQGIQAAAKAAKNVVQQLEGKVSIARDNLEMFIEDRERIDVEKAIAIGKVNDRIYGASQGLTKVSVTLDRYLEFVSTSTNKVARTLASGSDNVRSEYGDLTATAYDTYARDMAVLINTDLSFSSGVLDAVKSGVSEQTGFDVKNIEERHSDFLVELDMGFLMSTTWGNIVETRPGCQHKEEGSCISEVVYSEATYMYTFSGTYNVCCHDMEQEFYYPSVYAFSRCVVLQLPCPTSYMSMNFPHLIMPGLYNGLGSDTVAYSSILKLVETNETIITVTSEGVSSSTPKDMCSDPGSFSALLLVKYGACVCDGSCVFENEDPPTFTKPRNFTSLPSIDYGQLDSAIKKIQYKKMTVVYTYTYFIFPGSALAASLLAFTVPWVRRACIKKEDRNW